MGVIYRAEDVWLKRAVAIKVIAAAYATDPRTTERFRSEARVLAEVRHDNVVQVYSFGPHPPSFYLAMELVRGRSLDEVIETHAAYGRCLDLDVAIAILRQVAGGLTAVHAHGIVHRDVKPSNIIIEASTGRSVLIDFGLARHDTDWRPDQSIDGSPAYMAPESASADDELTFRADIYSLGCTAFELLTGTLPFTGEDVAALLRAHGAEPRPLVSSRVAGLRRLDGVIARAMSKSPLDRYASPSDFLDELADAARDRRSGRPPQPQAAACAQRLLRVFVLARSEPLRRQVARIVGAALRPLDAAAAIDGVSTQSALSMQLARTTPDIVIIDAESVVELHGKGDAIDAARECVANVRATGAVVIVVQSDFSEQPLRFAELGARVVPRPMNPRLLEALVAQTSAARLR